MSPHQCPANGCTEQVDHERLMCVKHWYMVPRPLRRAVWTEYERGDAITHARVCARAIDVVNRKLAAA